MRLHIKNEPKKLGKDLVRKAARYYIERLLNGKDAGITVSIKFEDELKGYHGYCVCTENAVRPKRFLVVINSRLGKRKMLECLAHEMVHVKQYALGELWDYRNPNLVKWCGKKFYFDASNDELYYDSPWEIEAYGRSIGLYVGFKKKYLRAKPA